jgi:8-oxo-dGTP diphosphatase
MNLRRSPLVKVTAAVIEKNGRIMIARRRKGEGHGGSWEFPGGKLEPGETPEEGLKRELAEEFGVKTSIGDFIGSFPYQSARISLELLVFRAVVLGGNIHLKEHEEVRWVLPEEMREASFSEPDRPAVRRLKSTRASI